MVDKIASVDQDRCIGGGLCITTCKASALQLKKKGKETVPPKDQDSLYKKIMMEKLGPWGTAKMMGKMLTQLEGYYEKEPEVIKWKKEHNL